MFKEKLSLVPTKPGCYIMKNDLDHVIYVGKAKNLKNRLRSYFNGNNFGKTLKLVNNIENFEYIVTNNETEALLLELNLIKEYNPKYNILLKDDKSYPYIELSNDKYPIIRVVRNKDFNKKKKRGLLFGPFPNVSYARELVSLLSRLFKLRKCENLPKKPCLYYHIGQCLGYCINDIDQDVILNSKEKIINFFKGDQKEILEIIDNKIKDYSVSLNYEKALEYKKLMDFILNNDKEQKIDLKRDETFDIFGYFYENGYLVVQTFFVRNGKMISSSYNIVSIIDSVEEEIIEYIIKFYEDNNLIIPKLVLVPNIVNSELLSNVLKTKFNIPKKGNKKKLLEMANTNAFNVLKEKKEIFKMNEDRTVNAFEELGKLLGVFNLNRIEAFDNSNLFGSFIVSGMVVFENGVPVKNEYRKFKINTVNVSDDYKAMKEVIYRRYFRVLKDNLKRPDIIIVDGGIGQINVANEIIKDLNLDILVFGLKKDDKHRTSQLLGGNPIKVYDIPKRSNIFFLLERIQDEVHNYAISYHRKLRSKGAFEGVLALCSGIGPSRRKKLLKKYGSLKKIKEASIDELSEILPYNIAFELYNSLK